ncbi:hypothetical protein LEP1GSC052_0671 [Leptospira kmetyi serovar Malaysia str. Bejo-Iso9]|nr:hypothetical protein LEP1GSC052_0671 [Leptospira kmetyi serovar Malaysia str. Bejo-Iso9]
MQSTKKNQVDSSFLGALSGRILPIFLNIGTLKKNKRFH